MSQFDLGNKNTCVSAAAAEWKVLISKYLDTTNTVLPQPRPAVNPPVDKLWKSGKSSKVLTGVGRYGTMGSVRGNGFPGHETGRPTIRRLTMAVVAGKNAKKVIEAAQSVTFEPFAWDPENPPVDSSSLLLCIGEVFALCDLRKRANTLKVFKPRLLTPDEWDARLTAILSGPLGSMTNRSVPDNALWSTISGRTIGAVMNEAIRGTMVTADRNRFMKAAISQMAG